MRTWLLVVDGEGWGMMELEEELKYQSVIFFIGIRH